MNGARLVPSVDPSVVPATESEQPVSVARERVPQVPQVLGDEPHLGRALAVSLCVAAVLALAAFWPAAPDRIRPRPALKAPIVFDVLNPAPLPKAYPGSGPEASSPSAAASPQP